MNKESESRFTESILSSWGGYWRYQDYLDYCYLVTPYYPPQDLIEELKNNFEKLLTNYPSGMKVNAQLAAELFEIDSERIVVGNGAAELIKSIMNCFQGNTGFIKPTFDEYPNRYARSSSVIYSVENNNFSYTGKEVIEFFAPKDISNLVIVNPDNPSGNYVKKGEMIQVIGWAMDKGIHIIVDESFVDFVDEHDPTLINQSILDKYHNLYIIKSISKSFGVPGLRLGVLASGDTEMISYIKKDVSIWNINSFAEFYMQIAGKYKKDYDVALEMFREERLYFENRLKSIDHIRVIPSQANYVMVELMGGVSAENLQRRMLIDHKIIIKTLGKKISGSNQFLRLAIRNRDDNNRFLKSIECALMGLCKQEKKEG